MKTLDALLSLIDEVATTGLTLARATVRLGTRTVEIAIRILGPR